MFYIGLRDRVVTSHLMDHSIVRRGVQVDLVGRVAERVAGMRQSPDVIEDTSHLSLLGLDVEVTHQGDEVRHTEGDRVHSLGKHDVHQHLG